MGCQHRGPGWFHKVTGTISMILWKKAEVLLKTFIYLDHTAFGFTDIGVVWKKFKVSDSNQIKFAGLYTKFQLLSTLKFSCYLWLE